ncbi:hypothetical protein BCAR13_2350002 [Paraburkholderia caribensis]|nr:hypothetical protein BCAR13_2350002 [Paraburkholderia caribensis]
MTLWGQLDFDLLFLLLLLLLLFAFGWQASPLCGAAPTFLCRRKEK